MLPGVQIFSTANIPHFGIKIESACFQQSIAAMAAQLTVLFD